MIYRYEVDTNITHVLSKLLTPSERDVYIVLPSVITQQQRQGCGSGVQLVKRLAAIQTVSPPPLPFHRGVSVEVFPHLD